MSPELAVLAIGAGLGGLAVVVNHMIARLGLIEVVLNEGLPPGYEANAPNAGPDPITSRRSLDQGIHVFLSQRCHGCRRLVTELAERQISGATPISFYLVDHARRWDPADTLARLGSVAIDQKELADRVGADPLPYAVAIGPDGLVAGGVLPAADKVGELARHCGLEAPFSAGDPGRVGR